MKNKFKQFYKIVNYVRKSLNTEIVMCKEEDCTVTSEKNKIFNIWPNHFISIPGVKQNA